MILNTIKKLLKNLTKNLIIIVPTSVIASLLTIQYDITKKKKEKDLKNLEINQNIKESLRRDKITK